jgi:hypothetical protein
MSMNIVLAIGLLTLVPAGLALLFLCRAILSRQKSTASLDELSALSPGNYRPMERLLRQEDFEFLEKQPGYTPRLGRRFRTERRKLFRGYLRNLKKDFGRVTAACHELLIHSDTDRGDLGSALMRQRLTFTFAMMAVEGRLLLHAAGVGTVEVSGLVESLETMQEQIRFLVSMPQTAGAGA